MADFDASKLDPELQEKIRKWQAESPANKQLEVLTDVADMIHELVVLFDEQGEKSEKGTNEMGATLLDIREKLGSLDSKETPEMPDYAKPVVKAVESMQKALEASIKAIEVKPEVKVNVPDITAPDAPEVDLSALEKIIKTDVPKAFKEAIELIPTPEIPESDYTELADLLSAQLNWLESIDTASRMKPQFPVSQLNSIKAGIDTIATNTTGIGTTNYTTRIEEDSGDSNITYIGKAAIGSATSSAVWQIQKIDETTGMVITWGGTGAFDQVWNNRVAGVYS